MITNPFVRRSPGELREHILSIDSFTHGMNNVSPEASLANNEAINTKNMMFIANSVMEKRYGTKIANTNHSQLSGKITWVDEYKPVTGAQQVIRGTNTGLYNDANTMIGPCSGPAVGTNYIGRYYWVDGTALRVYDGTNWYKIISDPHARLMSSMASGGTNMTLDEIPETVAVGSPVHIRYADGDTQNTTVASINAGSKQVTLTTGVTQAITVVQDVPYYVYFYIPNPTSMVLGNWVWDGTKHLAYYCPGENELKDPFAGLSYVPKNPNVIAVHKDRLFIAGDTTAPHNVYLSAIQNPIYFPSGAAVGVTPNGDAIMDLVVFDNSLIIGRKEDMFVLYGSSELIGSTSDPFVIKKMDVSVGFMSRNCGALINNYYIYLGYDGRFYRLNTPTTFVEYLMTKPLEHKIDLTKKPFNLPRGNISCQAIAYYNEVWFQVADDILLIYNFDVQGWTYYQGIHSSSLFTDGLTLYFGRTDGLLTNYLKDGTWYNDMTVPYEANYETKRFDLENSARFKYFKRFMITSQAFDIHRSNISVEIQADDYTLSQGLEFSSNFSRFSSSRWGDRFNLIELIRSPWFNIDIRARTIKFKFINGHDNEPMRIFNVDVCYSTRDVR